MATVKFLPECFVHVGTESPQQGFHELHLTTKRGIARGPLGNSGVCRHHVSEEFRLVLLDGRGRVFRHEPGFVPWFAAPGIVLHLRAAASIAECVGIQFCPLLVGVQLAIIPPVDHMEEVMVDGATLVIAAVNARHDVKIERIVFEVRHARPDTGR